MAINRLSWIAQRTRWKMSRNGNLYRGTPNGQILTVFEDKWGRGWKFCINDNGDVSFSEHFYKTRKLAKQAAERAGMVSGTAH